MYIRTSFVCSSLRVSSIRIYILILGLLTHNATWCQNRGCICISSVRRTYGRIHMLPAYIQSPDKYNNSVNRIISKEEEREDIQGEILQSSSSTVVFPHTIHSFYKNYSVPTCNPATPRYFYIQN